LPMIHPLRPKGESQFASNRNPDSDFSFDALVYECRRGWG
jgi:hypothetical protein